MLKRKNKEIFSKITSALNDESVDLSGLSKRSGISYQHLYRIARGERSIDGLGAENFLNLADALGLSGLLVGFPAKTSGGAGVMQDGDAEPMTLSPTEYMMIESYRRGDVKYIINTALDLLSLARSSVEMQKDLAGQLRIADIALRHVVDRLGG